MKAHTKKTYKNYRFNTRNEAFAELYRGPPNTDRKYMHEILKPNFEYLEQKGISEYQNFIEIFKDHGYLMKCVKDFIDEFTDFINLQKQKQGIEKIEWINNRQLNKANSGEMNIILNRLSLQYPNEMSDFVEIFIQNHPNKILSRNSFVQRFKNNIQMLLSSSLNKNEE